MTRLLAAALVLTALVFPSPLRASGPGVHMVEVDDVLTALVAEDEHWAALAEYPEATLYLHFGSISPDFEKACRMLPFGHEKELSYHLLEEARLLERPDLELFALGHLAHQGSDGAMEGLIVPTFFSSAPLGLYSMFGEYADGRADSEGIIETFGDLILGDWMAVVDVLFYFGLEDEEALARADEVFYWYCETGAAFDGRPVDCDEVDACLRGKIATAGEALGGMGREQAKALITTMLDQPLTSLADLATTGLLTSWLSGEIEQGPEFDREAARFRESAFVDPAFWTLYDQLRDLGPRYALDFLREGTATRAWPIYDGDAIICGNLLSVMNFLPEHYEVVPGLIVDRLWYEDGDGTTITEVTGAEENATLTAHARFFSSLPFQGRIVGRVWSDHPGFARNDALVGEATVDVDIDPLAYATEPRSTIAIPFTADPTQAVGFYVELLVEGSDKPWFTTSWDRLWSITELDFSRAIYRDNFGTYGHWPPSLPLAEPSVDDAALLVKVHVAPAGPGIEGAEVHLEGSGMVGPFTGANGIVAFDWLGAGHADLYAQAEGYEGVAGIEVDLPANELTWHQVPMHAIPELVPPGAYWGGSDNLPLTWDRTRLGGQGKTIAVQAFDAESDTALGEALSFGPRDDIVLPLDPPLADGARVKARGVVSYTDDSEGVEGWSDEVVVDASAPLVEVVVEPTADTNDWCPPPEGPALTLTVTASDPHSPIVETAWSADGDTWTPLESGVAVELSALEPLPGGPLSVRAVNAAGLVTLVEDISLPAESPSCGLEPEPVVEAPESVDVVETQPMEVIDEVEADVVSEPDAGGEDHHGSSGGCTAAAGSTPHSETTALLAGLLLLGAALRRRGSRAK